MLDHVFFTFHSLISRLVFFFNPYKSKALKENRINLSNDILSLVNKHIDNVDPKYKQERILFSNENKDNLSEERIIIRRNSMRKSSNLLNEHVLQAINESEKNKKN
jgi:hypothetical protein